jgi:hypothetical protein
MGKLIYAPGVEIDLPDLSLLHLDALLAENPDARFQLHVHLGAAEDGDMLSLSVGAGTALILKYGNSADLELDIRVMIDLSRAIVSNAFVVLPILPVAGSPDPYTA